MKEWKIAVPALVIVLLFIAWYAFRPERLITNHRASEAFPATNGGSPAQALDYLLGDGTRVLRFANFRTST